MLFKSRCHKPTVKLLISRDAEGEGQVLHAYLSDAQGGSGNQHDSVLHGPGKEEPLEGRHTARGDNVTSEMKNSTRGHSAAGRTPALFSRFLSLGPLHLACGHHEDAASI